MLPWDSPSTYANEQGRGDTSQTRGQQRDKKLGIFHERNLPEYNSFFVSYKEQGA